MIHDKHLEDKLPDRSRGLGVLLGTDLEHTGPAVILLVILGIRLGECRGDYEDSAYLSGESENESVDDACETDLTVSRVP